ncbi:hypothetical protein [Halalkalibacter okhensis]|uniref:Transcriptional regulator n=1 Tax=Halalkalibacter okhensis TaxID=333138 RepID=A0A0B0I9E6_9BACI|nr:hypothetical protein [Halalkalibacter okhensis]KHF39158.1 hypothetical protein LQ50_17175 [Halalkalibacter okhensis]
MNIRLGVVGPRDSVEIIRQVAETSENVELFLFHYETTEEVKEIIKTNRDLVDQWLFSGQAPYAVAVESGVIDEDEGSYPILHGTSLLGKFLEAQFALGGKMKSISLDTIQQKEIDWVKANFSLDDLTIHMFPYEGYVPAQDIIHFHEELYESGEVEVVFTCIQAVYNQLIEKNIPCYRIIPLDISIQETLRYLKTRAESHWYRKAQLAMVGIEILHTTSDYNEQQFSYKRKHQELELKRILLDYAEELQGSFVQSGDSHFYIYTTRGEIESRAWPIQVLDDALLLTKLPVRLVIGFGVTALDTEKHVRVAFQHARKHDDLVIIIVNENQEVTEVFESNEVITYQQRNSSSFWKERLQDSNISPAVASKIVSMARHYKKEMLTTQDVASWLHGTERNARRILTELEKVGVVQVCGEEQSGGRGRPRKVYELQN